METCIIGGGFSGIISAKLCLDHGLTPYILCKSPHAGGLWNALPSEIGVWDSMLTNTSKYNTSFSDFPWNSEDPDYPTIQQVRNYLTSYIEKHSLLQYFNFNSTVVNVSRHEDDYKVQWTSDSELKEKVFKYVIIATGRSSRQFNPVANIEAYNGIVLHAGEYRDSRIFAGKKVVCVGRSFSGSDIAVDALNTASQVTQFYWKPYGIIRRYLRQVPSDLITFSCKSLSTPIKLLQTFESNNLNLRNLNTLFGNPSEIHPDWEIPEAPTQVYKSIKQSEEYLNAVACRRITVIKGRAKEFYCNGIVLNDGRQIEADVVILGTGYIADYSYLSQELQDIIQYRESDVFISAVMYRSIVHPALPQLCFVGKFVGSHTGRFELAAEVGIRYMMGKLRVTQEELWQGVRDEEFIRENLREFTYPYGFLDYLKELLRILEIKIDYNFIRDELEFANGPLLPQMFWMKTTEQIELSKQVIAEIKGRFPHFGFN